MEAIFAKEELTPYTLIWDDDHVEFLNALRAPYDPKDEEALPNIERSAYEATLQNPHSVKKISAKNFKARATRRGKSRALLQAALQTLATNVEQHHHDAVWRPVMQLERQPHRTAVTAQTTSSKDLAPSPEPSFPFTKSYLEFRSKQRLLRKLVAASSSGEDAQAWNKVGDWVFSKPFASKFMIDATMRKPLNLVRMAIAKLRHAQKFIDADLSQGASSELLTQRAQYVAFLSSVEEASNLSDFQTLLDRNEHSRHLQVLSKHLVLPEDLQDLERLLSFKFTGMSDAEIRVLGRGFGQLLQRLVAQISTARSTAATSRNLLVQRAREALKKRRFEMQSSPLYLKEQCPSLSELAQSLYNSRGRPSHEAALTFLKNQLVDECHKNAGHIATNHEELWSFAATSADPNPSKRWFHLDKWTLEGRPRIVRSAAQKGKEPILPDMDRSGSEGDDGEALDDQPTNNHHPFDRPATKPQIEIGHGHLMPREIMEFDWDRDAKYVENAPDPEEHYVREALPCVDGVIWADWDSDPPAEQMMLADNPPFSESEEEKQEG